MSKTSEGDPLRSLAFLLETTRELLGEAGGPLAPWEARLSRLEAAEDRVLRVAVAGTVKSGKSTLVNALVGRDVVKRGAGIITSLVTQVRPGSELRARMQLKGWAEVNREATDAALFLGAGEDGGEVDLRRAQHRQRLARVIDELGDAVLGEGGFFDKNVALLRAYLQGYERVEGLVEDEEHTVEFAGAEFGRHQEFSGHDALAAYVDDLILEIPGLPFEGAYEIGDCQGYDSPNPRHMEKVQQYLMGAHLVVYVVSSRVGLREADLRFVRDIKAMGLLESTQFVLNADLGEHTTVEDLPALRERMASELRSLAGEVPIHTVSALRALLLSLQRDGETLSRKDELLLELWNESPALAAEDFGGFLQFLEAELGEHRRGRFARAREAVAREGTDALRARVETVLAVVGKRAETLETEERALREARDRVQTSLESFESSLQGMADNLRRELYREVDAAFHPSGGTLAAEVFDQVRSLEAPSGALEDVDRKRLLRQMARIYQEMRAAFHRYKVEVVNPEAVERIRAIWRKTSSQLASAAGPPAELLVRSVEAYRKEAGAAGIELAPLELRPLDPSIGRHTIPLFSAVTYGSPHKASDRVLAFAGQWTRKLAAGWAKRLMGKKERQGFAQSLLTDGGEAVRELLSEEARSNLLHYNEQLKYQVLGKSLDELVSAWCAAYRQTVDVLVVDLDRLVEQLDQKSSEGEDLIPRLQGILRALERAAA